MTYTELAALCLDDATRQGVQFTMCTRIERARAQIDDLNAELDEALSVLHIANAVEDHIQNLTAIATE